MNRRDFFSSIGINRAVYYDAPDEFSALSGGWAEVTATGSGTTSKTSSYMEANSGGTDYSTAMIRSGLLVGSRHFNTLKVQLYQATTGQDNFTRLPMYDSDDNLIQWNSQLSGTSGIASIDISSLSADFKLGIWAYRHATSNAVIRVSKVWCE